MNGISWTEAARGELQNIYDYIARDSPAYADRTIERLVLTAERAAEFPRSGRVVPELANPSIRQLLVGDHWLVYRIEREGITILTVLHGAQERSFPGVLPEDI